MVEITLELLQSKISHLERNESYSQLYELSLHQSYITSINKLIQAYFPNINILYLQNNYIQNIENIFKLKLLQYLNISINCITTIPKQLYRLEALEKLDLTLNFIQVKELDNMCDISKQCILLKDITLLGNPCISQFNEWFNKTHNDDGVNNYKHGNNGDNDNTTVDLNNRYRLYIISQLSLPTKQYNQCNLLRLDNQDITHTEQLTAKQLKAVLHNELQQCIEYWSKQPVLSNAYTAQQRLADYEADIAMKQQKEINQNKIINESVNNSKNYIELSKDVLREKVAHNGDSDMLPIQRNTGKYEFTIDYDYVKQYGYIILTAHISKYITNDMIDIDIHNKYVQCIIDKHNLLIHIQHDYIIATDKCKLQRLTHNGQLKVFLAVEQYIDLCDKINTIELINVANNNNKENDSNNNKQKIQSNNNNSTNKHEINTTDNDTANNNELTNNSLPFILKRTHIYQPKAQNTNNTVNDVNDDDDTSVPPLE